MCGLPQSDPPKPGTSNFWSQKREIEYVEVRYLRSNGPQQISRLIWLRFLGWRVKTSLHANQTYFHRRQHKGNQKLQNYVEKHTKSSAMCSSINYPYLPHRRDLFQDPHPTPLEIPIKLHTFPKCYWLLRPSPPTPGMFYPLGGCNLDIFCNHPIPYRNLPKYCDSVSSLLDAAINTSGSQFY